MSEVDAGDRAERVSERVPEALDRVEAILVQLGLQGLQRVTRSSAAEIKSVGQSAHTAGLIRIERELEALATHAARYLAGDPLFRTHDWAGALNRVWLLARTTRAWSVGAVDLDPVELLGEARRAHVEVAGMLEVHAIAASGWVTDTDFVGVTVWLHHDGPSGPQLFQVSTVRPVMAFGRDPRRLLFQPVSEHLDLSLADLAHGSFAFAGAKVSRDGRLSLHRELRIAPAADPGAGAYAPWRVDDWHAALERVRAAEVTPLGGSGGALSYVEPAGWGALELDDKRSRARLSLLDATGAVLWAHVQLAPENNLLVDNLQALVNDPRIRPRGLFGRVGVADGQLRLYPWTGVWERAVLLKMRGERRVHQVHLSLEPLAAARFT